MDEGNRLIRSKIATTVRSLLSWVAAAVTICAATGGYYYFTRMDEELHSRIEQVFARQYPHHTITIKSAHLAPEGIRLRGLSIVRPADVGLRNRVELLFCQEVVLHCDPTLPQLLQGAISIPHVQLRGLSIHPTREADGSWNLEELIPPKSDRPMPTIEVQDAHVELIDRKTSPPSVLSLSNLQCNLNPDATSPDAPTRSLTLHGRFRSDHTGEVELRGKISPETLGWTVEGAIRDLKITTELLDALPSEVSIPSHDLDGLLLHASLGFKASFNPQQDRQPRYAATASVIDGRFEARRQLADPITGISAEVVRCDNSGWEINGLHARYGAARIAVKSATHDYSEDLLVVSDGNIEDLTITRELVTALPKNLQQVWNKYQPLGETDIVFQAFRRHDKWWSEGIAEFKNVSLVCEKFKYPLVRSRGKVHFRQDEFMTVDLEASADYTSADNPIRIIADIRRPGPNGRGTVRVSMQPGHWLPLDQRLISALSPALQRTVAKLGAQGEVSVEAKLTRDSPQGEVAKDITVLVRDAAIRYEGFRYPLTSVTGKLRLQQDEWTFEGFRGRNDSCVVQCVGNWRPIVTPQGLPGGHLQLDFLATDIPCDAELRESLPSGPRTMWNSLRPTGTVDEARIRLSHRTGMPKPDVGLIITQKPRQQDLERRSLIILPTWFPLRMDQVSGTFVYNVDGTFTLGDLQAKHVSPNGVVEFQADGDGRFRDDGTWDLNLNELTTGQMPTTTALIGALPGSLGSALTELHFAGRLSVNGQMAFAGSGDPGEPIKSRWSLRVDVDDGSFKAAGQSIERLFGYVSVAGGCNGLSWSNSGRVRFDSLVCRDIFLNDVDGPWRMDPERLVLGVGAATSETPPEDRHMRARVLGGIAEADGFVELGGDHLFQFDALLNDVDVAEVARDLALPSQVTGRGFARLNLSGNTQGAHSLSGDGQVRLRNANIAKLPAIIALWNNLSLRDTPPDVFSSSDLDFEIEGRNIKVVRFDLLGESLTMKGQGWASLDRRIDLAFYTILGGENRWLPFFRPWLGQASQQFLQILAKGTMDQPEWRTNVLPGFNETLQQLFPEQRDLGSRRPKRGNL